MNLEAKVNLQATDVENQEGIVEVAAGGFHFRLSLVVEQKSL